MPAMPCVLTIRPCSNQAVSGSSQQPAVSPEPVDGSGACLDIVEIRHLTLRPNRRKTGETSARDLDLPLCIRLRCAKGTPDGQYVAAAPERLIVRMATTTAAGADGLT